jgi:hypothetical protein
LQEKSAEHVFSRWNADEATDARAGLVGGGLVGVAAIGVAAELLHAARRSPIASIRVIVRRRIGASGVVGVPKVGFVRLGTAAGMANTPFA